MAGSLEDATSKLNPIKWRIRAKRKGAPDLAICAFAGPSLDPLPSSPNIVFILLTNIEQPVKRRTTNHQVTLRPQDSNLPIF
jgi:hypothetical protein